MCRRKPYPRCSSHATKRLNSALQTGDPELIKEAKRDYFTSPAGIRELREAGKEELANKYARRREALIAQAKRQELASKTPIRLALDLDETSGGFIDSMREELARREGLTPEQAAERYPVPRHYSLVESGWFKDVTEFMSVFKEAEANGVYTKMRAFDGVSKTLRKLVDNRDVEVHVVTARKNEWNADTRAWLRKNHIPFRSITHTEDKENVKNIDVYIDDSDKQIKTLTKNGKTVIAFNNAYNEDVPSKYRVKAWKEVPAVLKLIKTAQ